MTTPALASESVAAAPTSGLHVLLVEDNPVNRAIAIRLLEKRGYLVTAVENGALAVEITDHERFDIVLMDVQMPVMDGITATKSIRDRERDRGGHVPIVAVTAHALDQDRQRCLAAGMDDYLPKPIRTPDLFATITKYCQAQATA
jgi:CheY-like chemotaxis protein